MRMLHFRKWRKTELILLGNDFRSSSKSRHWSVGDQRSYEALSFIDLSFPFDDPQLIHERIPRSDIPINA